MLDQHFPSTLVLECSEVFGLQGTIWPSVGCGPYGCGPYGESMVQHVGSDEHGYPGGLVDCDQWHIPMAQGSSTSFSVMQGPQAAGQHTTPQQQSQKENTVLPKTQSKNTWTVVENGFEMRHRRRRRGLWSVQSYGRVIPARTVLSESQLRVLLTCYSRTPRPDPAAKQRLGLMTGLSPRVIRVWFQNKRCKDKNGRRNETLFGAAYEPAGPMVVLSPDPPDLALQISVFESPWQLRCSHRDVSLCDMSFNTSYVYQEGTHHNNTAVVEKVLKVFT